jgi:translation initiation factor IF-3
LYHNKRIRINRWINVSQVRLVDSDGTMLGVKPIQEAMQLARNASLDLVEIAPQAVPPVCKIMDFSKYLYEKDKQDRENRKKQKVGMLKEIRFNPRIAQHDLDTKIKHIAGFLQGQDKVRVTVVFKGRENQHRDLGEKILQDVVAKLTEFGNQEGRFSLVGNRMSVMLSPKPLPKAAAPKAAAPKGDAKPAEGGDNPQPPAAPKAPEAPAA